MSLRYLFQINILNKNTLLLWNLPKYYSQGPPQTPPKQPEKSGFAKAFDKFEFVAAPQKEKPQTFKELLMNSKFIDLGDPEGKIVTGKIVHVVDDDLYIDFGWKFDCVCTRPKANASSYVRGAKVRLMIKDLELSSRFIGYERDLTLLEADCALLGLVQDRGSKIPMF